MQGAARPFLPPALHYKYHAGKTYKSRYVGFYQAYLQLLPSHVGSPLGSRYWHKPSYQQVVRYAYELHQVLITLMYGKGFVIKGNADVEGNVTFLANLVQLATYYGCQSLVTQEIEDYLLGVAGICEDVAHDSTFHLVLGALAKSKRFFLDALRHHINYYEHDQTYRELDAYQHMLLEDTVGLLHLSRSQITNHVLKFNHGVGRALQYHTELRYHFQDIAEQKGYC